MIPVTGPTESAESAVPIDSHTERTKFNSHVFQAILNSAEANGSRFRTQIWPTPPVYPLAENGEDDSCTVYVLDEPGPGGAHHEYFIQYEAPDGLTFGTVINFQKGGIGEVGVNGLTIESLLAIARHRLECFENGPFRCEENAAALIAVSKAMHALQVRTNRRRRLGVEGKQVEPGPIPPTPPTPGAFAPPLRLSESPNPQ